MIAPLVYFDKRKQLIFASVFRCCEVLKQAEIGVNSMFLSAAMCIVITLLEDGLLLVFLFRTEESIWHFALRRASRAIPFARVSPRARI